MPDETIVIYNETCPICSREIELYRARTEAANVAIRFAPIGADARHEAGLTSCEAARRLHVVEGEQVLRGVDAFVRLWQVTPGFQWLARLVAFPVIRPVAYLVYEYVLAPGLFALHKRRQRKQGKAR